MLIKGNFKDEIKANDEIEFNDQFNNNITKFNTTPYFDRKIRENKERKLEDKNIKKDI